MGQLKGYQVDEWLARTSPDTPVVLIYGPDRGLVSERARLYADKSGVTLGDPFSVVRLDATELEKQPGRLVDEAGTFSMFAGRRLIWIRNASAQKSLSDDLKRLCAVPAPDTLILVEAGDLKKSAALRAVIEASPNALALPCYADDEQATNALIDRALERERLSIDPEARSALVAGLGSDRIATRSELQKLVLAAMDSKTISLADVRQLVGDIASHSSDDIIDAMLDGDVVAFDRSFAAQIRAASHVQGLLSAVLRQFQLLHQLRSGMERERRSASAAVAGARPPVFFARRKTFETALERRNVEELSGVLGDLQGTVLQARMHPELAVAIVHEALLKVMLSGRR